MTLGKLLHQAANRQPKKTALICKDWAMTYAELDQSARDLARWFLREGLRPGDRVTIHWANSIEAARVLLACFHARLIAVPLNTRMKAAELAFVLGNCRPAMCFSQPELAPIAEAARAELPALPAIQTTVPAGLVGADLPEGAADDPALILYTSGTTARPKGVIHTHQTLLHAAEMMGRTGLNGAGTILVMVPIMHASGLISLLLPGLLAGATLVLIPAFDAAAVLDAIERHRCTYGGGLPAMMHFLVAEQGRQPRAVDSLRVWAGGGDVVPFSLREKFQSLFQISLQEAYAMTESIPICWNTQEATRSGSLGLAFPGIETRVIDDAGRDLPPGETGELAIRSPANFVGYWDNPAATAETLRDGWLRTGDLVRRDPDGFHWFAGRKKEIIIRGGSNISPQEVEEVIYRHPAVREAGVIGLPDAVFGEQVVACVALRDNQSVDEPQLKAFARERLADYKVPERIVFLRDLPKGLTGKVQRRALREMASTPDGGIAGVNRGKGGITES